MPLTCVASRSQILDSINIQLTTTVYLCCGILRPNTHIKYSGNELVTKLITDLEENYIYCPIICKQWDSLCARDNYYSACRKLINTLQYLKIHKHIRRLRNPFNMGEASDRNHQSSSSLLLWKLVKKSEKFNCRKMNMK